MAPQPLLERLITHYSSYCNFMGILHISRNLSKVCVQCHRGPFVLGGPIRCRVENVGGPIRCRPIRCQRITSSTTGLDNFSWLP